MKQTAAQCFKKSLPLNKNSWCNFQTVKITFGYCVVMLRFSLCFLTFQRLTCGETTKWIIVMCHYNCWEFLTCLMKKSPWIRDTRPKLVYLNTWSISHIIFRTTCKKKMKWDCVVLPHVQAAAGFFYCFQFQPGARNKQTKQLTTWLWVWRCRSTKPMDSVGLLLQFFVPLQIVSSCSCRCEGRVRPMKWDCGKVLLFDLHLESDFK